MTRPRIVIFVEEDDPGPDGYHYFLWGLHTAWLEMGIDVQVAKGLAAFRRANAGAADVVFPHFDETRTPADIQEALDGLPNVVNGGLHDISKRIISRQLVRRDDDWDGSVIVKTDRNTGGRPEATIADRRLTPVRKTLRRVRRSFAKFAAKDWRRVESIRDCQYPVFASKEKVPAGVWENPHLVVERFLPEFDGQLYYLRWYYFFGDRYRCVRVGSNRPVVKTRSKMFREEGLDVPPEVLEYRAQLNMDYGKIDYVMHEGRPVVLDVNKTPGGPKAERRLIRGGPLALGFDALRKHGPGAVRGITHVNVERQPFDPALLMDWWTRQTGAAA